MQLLHEMRSAGVRFLTGTDSGGGFAFLVPGFALHEELDVLARAGIPPIEILRAATLNAATYLGLEDSLGSVERGKAADLVLLEANPLENIRNTQRVQGVVRGGRYLDRRSLDALLAEAGRAAMALSR